MILKNKTIQKFISSFMIIAVILPSFVFFIKPKKADAQFTDVVNAAWNGLQAAYGFVDKSTNLQSTAIQIKNVAKEVFRSVLQAIARRMLADLTKSTVQWINTGNFGRPLFLTNPDSFFRDIAKGQIKNIVDTFGYDPRRFPFGRQYALQVIDNYRNTLENNASYSLSAAMPIEEQILYRENFNTGGWNAFVLNTQYPQNNIIGFNLLATEELGRRLAGTQNSVANNVRDTLQQGQGFLSPQVCLGDDGQPIDGMGINPYDPVTFIYFPPDSLMNQEPKEPLRSSFNDAASYNSAYVAYWSAHRAWVEQYDAGYNAARALWDGRNTCPPGRLRTTTPGSVAANQVMNALGTTQRQGELASQLQGSLSAVFDALINKFIGKGLSALTSTINPPADNWNYEGQTLGTGNSNINGEDDWNGADEIVLVADFKRRLAGETITTSRDGTTTSVVGKDFSGETITLNQDGTNSSNKKYLAGAIDNTTTELLLMDNKSWNIYGTLADQQLLYADPKKIMGITQWMEKIPNQVKSLDQCLPGPDKGWEQRMSNEKDRISDGSALDVFSKHPFSLDRVNIINTLNRSVSAVKYFIESKMIDSLPDGIIFLDEIKKLDTFTEKTKNLVDAKREKSTTLARLKAILISLNSAFPGDTDPAPGSTGERSLLTLWKSYKAIESSISTTSTIEQTRNELKILLDESNYLIRLNSDCGIQRQVAGWSTPTGLGEATRALTLIPPPTSFTWIRQYDDRKADNTYTEYGGTCRTTSGLQFPENDPVRREISCVAPRDKTGKEIEEFCELPLIGGHSMGELIHEDRGRTGSMLPSPLFKAQTGPLPNGFVISGSHIEPSDFGSISSTPEVMFPEIPMVNAMDIGDTTVNIDISCRKVWKADNLDYTHAGDVSF